MPLITLLPNLFHHVKLILSALLCPPLHKHIVNIFPLLNPFCSLVFFEVSAKGKLSPCIPNKHMLLLYYYTLSADQETVYPSPAYVQHEVSRSGYNTPVPCLCPKWSQQIRVQCTSSLPRPNMKSVDQGTVHPTHMFPVYIQNDRAQFFGELTSLSRVMQWLEIKIIWFPTKRGELSVLFEGPNKAMLRT